MLAQSQALGASVMIRRVLQIVIALLSINAIIGGGLYLVQGLQALVITGSQLTIDPTDADWRIIDYFVRALAGIWFTVGIMFMYMIPKIEIHTIWFRFACLAILFMGIGRLMSVISLGIGNNPLVALYLEVSLPLLLVWWQSVVAKKSPISVT